MENPLVLRFRLTCEWADRLMGGASAETSAPVTVAVSMVVAMIRDMWELSCRRKQRRRINSPRTKTSPKPSIKVIPINKKLDTRIESGAYVAGKLRDAEGRDENNAENVRWDFEVKSKESEGKENILR